MELYVGGQLLILSESPGDGEHNGAFAGENVVARSVTQICSLEYLNLVEQF